MVWDLGKAMRKKEEFESARLIDFEFRQRARAFKMLAGKLAIDLAKVVDELSVRDENALLDFVAELSGRARSDVEAEYLQCAASVRKQLIIERGDPTPNRLG